MPVPLGQGPHRFRLELPVGVELHRARVAPGLVDAGAAGDRGIRAEVAAERDDDLGRRGGHEHDAAAGRPMEVDQVGSLGVDDRVDDLLEGLVDDLGHPRLLPAAGEAEDATRGCASSFCSLAPRCR